MRQRLSPRITFASLVYIVLAVLPFNVLATGNPFAPIAPHISNNTPLTDNSCNPFTDATLNGSGSATPSGSGAGPFWPFATKSSSQYNRVDQGWDIQSDPGAAIYAIASGTIHTYIPDPGGFGNDYPVEDLDTSIGGPSNSVYYGHTHVLSQVLGKHVNAGDQIAVANTTDPQNGSAAPPGWLEIGFATPGTDAPVQVGSETVATQAGQDMKNILINAQPFSGSSPSPSPGPTGSASGCCSSGGPPLGGEAGSGPLFGLEFPKVADTNDLANRINKYIANTVPSSPLKTLGADFVAAGLKYDVNPALEVGIAQKESSLGTNQVPNSYDAWGLTAVGDVSGYPYVGGEYAFPSWQVGIDQATKYVGDNYVKPGSPYYSTTVLQFMQHYTPPDYVGQTAKTLATMHAILDGIATTGSVSPGDAADTGSTGAGPCSSSGGSSSGATAGPDGYNISEVNGVKGAPGSGTTNLMTQFYQCDPQWANDAYGAGKGSICASGCGITSAAMVVDTLAGKEETPKTLADRYGATYHIDGTSWALWPVLAQDYGLKEQDIGTDLNKAAQTIQAGGLVIISVGPGRFTGGGHFMVIRAIDSSGNFYLADPNGLGSPNGNTEGTGFSADYLRTTGDMLQLWAFTKS